MPPSLANDPAGISAVFVNGVAVVQDDTHTKARPGQVLRRARCPVLQIP